jgi:hypothetical protein
MIGAARRRTAAEARSFMADLGGKFGARPL